jgi:osmoprotectant transport system substrate-binding protein
MRTNRSFVLGATLLALAIFAGACGSGGGETTGGATPKKGNITVGVSAAFAENQIVAEMYAQVLEKAGYTVKRQLDLGSRELSDPALKSGQIDLKPEYLASELAGPIANAKDKQSGDAQAELAALKAALQPAGITVLNPSQANDTNAFVMTKEKSDQLGVTSVSQLAPVAGQLTLGGPAECPERPLCIPGLKDTYGVTFGKFEAIGVCDSPTAEALAAGRIDVALLCSTQSIIAKNGWVVLKDDKNLQPAELIVPVVLTSKVTAELTNLLNAVSSKLTTENIVGLNAKVEIDKEDAADVAKEFLQQNGLL